MHKKAGKNILLFALGFLFLTGIVFYIFSYLNLSLSMKSEKTHDADVRSYHIIITGSYENRMFLSRVFQGAEKYSYSQRAVIELYVPDSQAEDMSVQKLLDYAAYVNADGIIAYIDSPEEQLEVPYSILGDPIPLVTTGQYISNLPQVSFIGTSYWELGKKIAQETINTLGVKGKVIFVGNDFSLATNYSNLMSSIQSILKLYPQIEYSFEETIDSIDDDVNIIVCLSERSTIEVAQHHSEHKNNDECNTKIIGFGTNEVCRLYLDKGIVSELISVDPEKIGEAAIKELFEYRNKGYANSFIAADVQVSRSSK